MKSKIKYFKKTSTLRCTKSILAYVSSKSNEIYVFEKPDFDDFVGILIRQYDNSKGIVAKADLNYNELPNLIT